MNTKQKPPMPKCPKCNSARAVVKLAEFFCNNCKMIFDHDPEEGGDYSDRDPAARMMREEQIRQCEVPHVL